MGIQKTIMPLAKTIILSHYLPLTNDLEEYGRKNF